MNGDQIQTEQCVPFKFVFRVHAYPRENVNDAPFGLCAYEKSQVMVPR